jgi:ATP-dependent DNA ligase
VEPVPPMLAKLARELPRGDYLYEPKWDGFRCLAFRGGDEIDLRSRHGRPLARYFPELVEAIGGLPYTRLALDGEVVVVARDTFDFSALLARIHPAGSRVERLRTETPASFVAFDVLELGGELLLDRPFVERRARLESVLANASSPLVLTPITADPEVATDWLDGFGGGVDGVVAKARAARYQPGKRALVKVKRARTAECVVAGFRFLAERPAVSSLLLGLYDTDGRLEHVGITSSFSEEQRARLLATLRPLVTPLEGHPWEHGFLLAGSPIGRLRGSAGRWTPAMVRDWLPVRPELVCEVAYDQLDGGRFRHPARFLRWRPDREPESCTTEQLAVEPVDAGSLLAS